MALWFLSGSREEFSFFCSLLLSIFMMIMMTNTWIMSGIPNSAQWSWSCHWPEWKKAKFPQTNERNRRLIMTLRFLTLRSGKRTLKWLWSWMVICEIRGEFLPFFFMPMIILHHLQMKLPLKALREWSGVNSMLWSSPEEEMEQMSISSCSPLASDARQDIIIKKSYAFITNVHVIRNHLILWYIFFFFFSSSISNDYDASHSGEMYVCVVIIITEESSEKMMSIMDQGREVWREDTGKWLYAAMVMMLRNFRSSRVPYGMKNHKQATVIQSGERKLIKKKNSAKSSLCWNSRKSSWPDMRYRISDSVDLDSGS